MKEYWAQNEKELFEIFQTSRKGLSETEVSARQEEYGFNELKRKKSALLIFLRQFKSPLVWLLVATSIISMFFGEIINATIILVMIFLVSLVSFIQEYRSEKTVRDLNGKIAHKTIVIRNDEKTEIDVKNLVPGDIVVLNVGSNVPADLRLLYTKNLEMNEALLTGESVARDKNYTPLKKEAKSEYWTNYAYAGTSVVNGEALGLVIATGEQTQLGLLSKEVSQERPETEFQKGIKRFVTFLSYIVLFLTVIIFAVNAIFKHDLLSSLLFALAVAIGIAPELLPVIITVGLSNGAKIMAKKQVIVKRLVSIEDFGNMDILCTDKTGTLTEGNISLHNHLDFDDNINEDVLLYGLLCNSAIVHGKKATGNSIDVAILNYVSESIKEKSRLYTKVDEIPFDYATKRMSVLVKKGNKNVFITKGEPLSVLKVCSKIYLNGRQRDISRYVSKVEKKFAQFAEQGLRVIAVGYKEINTAGIRGEEKNLTCLGFITLSDPPKKTITESLKRLSALNIKLKILTGDNEIITEKIASDVGIHVNKIVLGADLEKLNDNDLAKIVDEADIFCRLTPLHKQRIIKALKKNGHDVGYMGDGINDIAALHEADVGISVNNAIDVAEDAADIVLLNKNLDILADGVYEGRKIFENSMKYILMGTSSDFGNMLSMSVASFFLPFLPMLPSQVLLNDLLYDVSQSTISSDNVDPEYLKKPKKFNLKLIRKYMLWFGPISSIYDFLTFGLMIYFFNANEVVFRTGWFIESIATQTLVVFVIRTRRSPFWKSKPGKWIWVSCISVVLAALVIPFTSLGSVFGFVPLPTLFFVFLAIMIMTYLLLAELSKRFFLKNYEI